MRFHVARLFQAAWLKSMCSARMLVHEAAYDSRGAWELRVYLLKLNVRARASVRPARSPGLPSRARMTSWQFNHPLDRRMTQFAAVSLRAVEEMGQGRRSASVGGTERPTAGAWRGTSAVTALRMSARSVLCKRAGSPEADGQRASRNAEAQIVDVRATRVGCLRMR